MSGVGFRDNKLAQVAIVVRDIEASKARWAAVLGVEVPETYVTDRGSVSNASYRGNPTDDAVKLAFFDLGGLQLELLEPIGTQNAWYEGMEERGERLHHLAFWVDNLDATRDRLAEQGVDQMMIGDMGGGGQYAYFDGNAQLGAVIELLHKPE